MESYTNYEDLDDMENPDQFTESQALPVDEHPPNGMLRVFLHYFNCNDSLKIVFVSTVEKATEERLCQLPLSRIKGIMKLDPELSLISSDSVFVMTKATELFIKSLARESFVFAEQGKKRTVQKKDLDAAINAVDALMFLEGALDFN